MRGKEEVKEACYLVLAGHVVSKPGHVPAASRKAQCMSDEVSYNLQRRLYAACLRAI